MAISLLLCSSCGTPVLITSHRCQRSVEMAPIKDQSRLDFELTKTSYSVLGSLMENPLAIWPCEILNEKVKTEGKRAVKEFEIISSFSWKDVLLGIIPVMGFRTVSLKGRFAEEEEKKGPEGDEALDEEEVIEDTK